MANVTRVKVVLKGNPGTTRLEKERSFKALLKAFRDQVNKIGILAEAKQKEFFESPGEKRRRKHKEAEHERRKSRGNNNV
jgi:ribosomal protein S21